MIECIKPKISALRSGLIVIKFTKYYTFDLDLENAKEFVNCLNLAIKDLEDMKS